MGRGKAAPPLTKSHGARSSRAPFEGRASYRPSLQGRKGRHVPHAAWTFRLNRNMGGYQNDTQSHDNGSRARQRRRSEIRIPSDCRGRSQGVSGCRCARRRGVQAEARHRACAHGRERSRQVDLDEDPRRDLLSRPGRGETQGRRHPAEVATRRTRERHRHDPSGTEPDAFHDRRREHLDPPGTQEPFRFRRSWRNAPHDGKALRAAQDRSRSGDRGPSPLGRQPPDGRDRQGGLLRVRRADHGRAHLGAHRARGRAFIRDHP